MNKGYFFRPVLTGTVSFMAFAALLIAGCKKDASVASPGEIIGARGYTDLKGFKQVNMVANTSGYEAGRIDPLLKNGWGISWAPSGVAWIAAQAGHVSTVYNGLTGAEVRPAVNIPSPGSPTGGNPTGTVFNGSAHFRLANNLPARFLFVGVDGILSGWNSGNNAQLIKDNSATAAYTGMTLANDAGSNFLYAANFRAGTIDVFDAQFNQVHTKPFVDPDLPTGYSPFNVEKVGDMLFVLYAMAGPDGRSAHRPAAGIVNVFTTGGMLVNRFASHGHLNAPWGIAMAPASFFPAISPGNNGSELANLPAILIGNFGDGKINVYTPGGNYMGVLKSGNKPIVIDGLWAISFAPVTATTIDPNRLFFAAGPNHEMDGLFGYIIKE